MQEILSQTGRIFYRYIFYIGFLKKGNSLGNLVEILSRCR